MNKKLPDIASDFSEWYNQVIYDAQLVDQAPVRGSVVIRPYGYAIWERIKKQVDERIKATGHDNVSFPLLIPESFLKKEAKHVEGFAPELAVVTHAGGKELEEPLVIRPTSETIIHYMFARWIKSWRDLPLKINQWANVMRWELRPRPFLRTTEFFWQEGHTAHATHEEALQEALLMLNEYVQLAIEYLAIPVVTGLKSESEKFPGADATYTFEALMPDGKALQMGTSHLLSQNFAKAFDMKYQDKEEKIAYPYLTSWAVTTRLVGALVMVHGDQKGLVIPPKIAPIQVVVVPIFKKGSEQEVLQEATMLANVIESQGIRVYLDDDMQTRPGAKFYNWELKGVPVRVEIGPKDIEQKKVMVSDRIGLGKEAVAFGDIGSYCAALLEKLQSTMYERALKKRDELWFTAQTLEQLATGLESNPGFYQTGWCGQQECENKLKNHKATTRCLLETNTLATCFACDQKSKHDVLVAKSY